MNEPKLIVFYTSQKHGGETRAMFSPCGVPVSPFLPPDCELLRRMAANRIREEEGSDAPLCSLRHASLSTWFDEKGQHEITEKALHKTLSEAGIRRAGGRGAVTSREWYACPPETLVMALESLRLPPVEFPSAKAAKRPQKPRKTAHTGHKAADALDWDEAMLLIRKLYEDGRYRDCLLVASGCFLGLRISDLLTLRWCDLCKSQAVTIVEKKTGKRRTFRINPALKRIAEQCKSGEGIEDDGELVFATPGTLGAKAISRQRADQILKESKTRYGLTSAATFSTHSLRKTFGRRVWLVQCDKGKGDQALLLLCDVFGHSSIAITKRYLGIRQDEILSVYDNL